MGLVFWALAVPSGPLLGMVSVVFFSLLPTVPARLEVGSDALVERWFGRTTRVIPLAPFHAALLHADRELHLEGPGTRLVVYTSERRTAVENPKRLRILEQRAVALLAAVREALAARGPEPVPAVVARLARGAQPASAWLGVLQKLRQSDGYRDVSLPEADLWATVESVAAPEDARGAAAYLLAGRDAGRLRAVEGATASPWLRAVLTAAADGDASHALVARR